MSISRQQASEWATKQRQYHYHSEETVSTTKDYQIQAMPFSTTGISHHCPGRKGKVGGISPGGCRKGKTPSATGISSGPYCTKHQDYCPRHPNWVFMKNQYCALCEGGRQNIVGKEYTIEDDSVKENLAKDKSAKNKWGKHRSHILKWTQRLTVALEFGQMMAPFMTDKEEKYPASSVPTPYI